LVTIGESKTSRNKFEGKYYVERGEDVGDQQKSRANLHDLQQKRSLFAKGEKGGGRARPGGGWFYAYMMNAARETMLQIRYSRGFKICRRL